MQMQMQMRMQMRWTGCRSRAASPQAPAADVPGGGREFRLELRREGPSSGSRSSTATPDRPRYLGQVDPRDERHRRGEAVRLQPQRRRGRERPPPRPDDPRRPDQRPGDDRPHRLRRGHLRRADRDRGRRPGRGGPAEVATSRVPEAARWQARGRGRRRDPRATRPGRPRRRRRPPRPTPAVVAAAPRSSPAPAVVAAAPAVAPPGLARRTPAPRR